MDECIVRRVAHTLIFEMMKEVSNNGHMRGIFLGNPNDRNSLCAVVVINSCLIGCFLLLNK